MTKEFFNEKVLEVDFNKLQPVISNKHVQYSLNFLRDTYGIKEGVKLSLKNFKQMFLDLISKFKSDVKVDVEDKYKQHGWNKFFNKLKRAFHKIWNRAFSIACSVTASAVMFTLGFMFAQSLMCGIIVCSIYTMITFSIKYFSASETGTNMFYEPGYVAIPKLSSIVNFFKFMYKFIKDTLVKVFEFFIYKIEDDDSKETIIRRRRVFLLLLILIFCIILI